MSGASLSTPFLAPFRQHSVIRTRDEKNSLEHLLHNERAKKIDSKSTLIVSRFILLRNLKAIVVIPPFPEERERSTGGVEIC